MGSTSHLRHRVGVLVSNRSREQYAAEAQATDEVYQFVDANDRQRLWLKGEYAYLAPNAVSTVLNRFNIKHDLLTEAEDIHIILDAYDTVFVPNAGYLEEQTINALDAWLSSRHHHLVVSGKTNLPPNLLGLSSAKWVAPVGWTGWKWTAESPFSDPAHWEEFYVTSHKGYTVNKVRARADARVLAELYEFSGDLTSASTAKKRLIGDAIVATDNTLLIANAVFEYLGGVLQAHLNVEEIRLWFNRTHWGDTITYFLREALRISGSDRLWDVRLKSFGSYQGVLQLRHDTDHEPDETIDRSIFEYEVENVVPASHFIMDPAFCTKHCTTTGARLWVEETAKHNFIEGAIHNDSAEGDPPTYIIGKGLYHHIKESQQNLGITSYTAGRHFGFLVYPETLDAMDYLYEHIPEFLGLCTFSLYEVIEYGVRNPEVVVEGKTVTYATYDEGKPEIPAAISGFWFPYHAVISTVDRQKVLRGWDVTHDTDCDYERIEELFSGNNSKSKRIESRLENATFTIHYGTQHARRPRFNKGRGHLPFVRYAVARAERCNFWLASKKMLYQKMNDFQDLIFRAEQDGTIVLHNPTSRPIGGLMVETKEPIGGVTDGDDLYIHIVDQRFFTIPVLDEGQTISLHVLARAKSPLISHPNTNTLQIFSARYSPSSDQISVVVDVVGKNYLVVYDLPGRKSFQAVIRDNRGEIHIDMDSKADGTLPVVILGPADNIMRVTISITPR